MTERKSERPHLRKSIVRGLDLISLLMEDLKTWKHVNMPLFWSPKQRRDFRNAVVYVSRLTRWSREISQPKTGPIQEKHPESDS